MQRKDINWWTERLAGDPFSLARYGDGELYCLWGRQGANSNGCNYTPELREDLGKTMVARHGFYHGLQRVLPHDARRAHQLYPHINWYDSEVFGEAVAAGELGGFIKQLRKMNVVLVSNKRVLGLTIFHGKNYGVIEVPEKNAHLEKDSVYRRVNMMKGVFRSPIVFMFSCGMAANVFVSELHDGKNFYLDLGHIWDPFVGNMSRCDLEGVSEETIRKNLCVD